MAANALVGPSGGPRSHQLLSDLAFIAESRPGDGGSDEKLRDCHWLDVYMQKFRDAGRKDVLLSRKLTIEASPNGFGNAVTIAASEKKLKAGTVIARVPYADDYIIGSRFSPDMLRAEAGLLLELRLNSEHLYLRQLYRAQGFCLPILWSIDVDDCPGRSAAPAPTTTLAKLVRQTELHKVVVMQRLRLARDLRKMSEVRHDVQLWDLMHRLRLGRMCTRVFISVWQRLLDVVHDVFPDTGSVGAGGESLTGATGPADGVSGMPRERDIHRRMESVLTALAAFYGDAKAQDDDCLPWFSDFREEETSARGLSSDEAAHKTRIMGGITSRVTLGVMQQRLLRANTLLDGAESHLRHLLTLLNSRCPAFEELVEENVTLRNVLEAIGGVAFLQVCVFGAIRSSQDTGRPATSGFPSAVAKQWTVWCRDFLAATADTSKRSDTDFSRDVLPREFTASIVFHFILHELLKSGDSTTPETCWSGQRLEVLLNFFDVNSDQTSQRKEVLRDAAAVLSHLTPFGCTDAELSRFGSTPDWKSITPLTELLNARSPFGCEDADVEFEADEDCRTGKASKRSVVEAAVLPGAPILRKKQMTLAAGESPPPAKEKALVARCEDDSIQQGRVELFQPYRDSRMSLGATLALYGFWFSPLGESTSPPATRNELQPTSTALGRFRSRFGELKAYAEDADAMVAAKAPKAAQALALVSSGALPESEWKDAVSKLMNALHTGGKEAFGTECLANDHTTNDAVPLFAACNVRTCPKALFAASSTTRDSAVQRCERISGENSLSCVVRYLCVEPSAPSQAQHSSADGATAKGDQVLCGACRGFLFHFQRITRSPLVDKPDDICLNDEELAMYRSQPQSPSCGDLDAPMDLMEAYVPLADEDSECPSAILEGTLRLLMICASITLGSNRDGCENIPFPTDEDDKVGVVAWIFAQGRMALPPQDADCEVNKSTSARMKYWARVLREGWDKWRSSRLASRQGDRHASENSGEDSGDEDGCDPASFVELWLAFRHHQSTEVPTATRVWALHTTLCTSENFTLLRALLAARQVSEGRHVSTSVDGSVEAVQSAEKLCNDIRMIGKLANEVYEDMHTPESHASISDYPLAHFCGMVGDWHPYCISAMDM